MGDQNIRLGGRGRRERLYEVDLRRSWKNRHQVRDELPRKRTKIVCVFSGGQKSDGTELTDAQASEMFVISRRSRISGRRDLAIANSCPSLHVPGFC